MTRLARDHAPSIPAARLPARAVGLSLVEVILVVAILAILAATAIPRFAAAVPSQTLELAARRVAADLRIAQANAIQRQQQQTVIIEPTATTYTLVDMPHPDHPARSFTVSLGAAPYTHVRILSADFAGQPTLTFDRFGSPEAAGTIVLGLRQYVRTVRISAGAGRITVE